MSLAIGRILPVLDPKETQWPYAVLGVAFAVYGVALIVYGGLPQKAATTMELGQKRQAATTGFAVAGGLLGLGTALLIVLS